MTLVTVLAHGKGYSKSSRMSNSNQNSTFIGDVKDKGTYF